jgi:hypothetical protein
MLFRLWRDDAHCARNELGAAAAVSAAQQIVVADVLLEL